jgi:outer membrane receptor protein involved in Fe transport
MKKSRNYRWLRAFLAAAVLGAFNAHHALAQTSAPPAAATAIGAPSELDEIVVTGTNIKQTIMQTSFSVTVVDQEALANSPALGLAALLTTIPGFYGEASAGEDNLNISARGVRGGFLEYISLQEDGLPTFYNGFLEELESRRDLTYGEMEVTRGGPSGVLTSNGAAAVVNFISRKATDTPEGEVAVSYYNYGEVRTDVFFGTPIGNSGDTSATFGGFYRRGDGVKNVGYDVNNGGQFRMTLTHKFDDSTSLMVTYKHIDDHSQFYLPQPVKITQDGSVQRISPIPGFNAETAYLQGSEMELVNIKSPNGDGQSINLQDGIWERSDTVTFIVSHDWQNGLRFNDSVRIAKIQTIDNDLRNLGGNSQIQSATSFLTTNPLVTGLISTFAPKGAVGAELVRVDSGGVIGNPAAMNGNGLVTQMGANQYSQSVNEIINDAQLSFHTDKNNATLGLLSWKVDMDVSQNGVDFLMDVTNQAHLLDVAAVNAAGQIVGHLTDNGVVQYDTGYANGTVNIKSNSLYLNDQFQPIDPLRLDAGVRYEKVSYSNLSENSASNVPLSGVLNPNVIADQAAAGYGTGTYTTGRDDLSATAWTAGANYLLSDNFAVYGRWSNAFDTGIANFAVFCPGSGCYSPLTRLRFGELGVRFQTSGIYAELTGFRSVNKNISEVIGNTGQQIFLNNVATGVEFDGKWRPIDMFTLDLSGVVQHSDLSAVGGTTSFDGNQIDRLPNVAVHLTPTVSTPDGRASAYVTVSYIGKRWGDLANTLQLDAYTDIAAGVSYKITPKMTLSAQGTNLTDRFSITEGNPRGNSVVAGSNPYGFARANLPRTGKFMLDVKF